MCFYHLRRVLSRAHGTLLVRAIKKRSALWSGRAPRSRISAAPRKWKKKAIPTSVNRRSFCSAFIHMYTHDAMYTTDHVPSHERVRDIPSRNAHAIMPKQCTFRADYLQQPILHGSGNLPVKSSALTLYTLIILNNLKKSYFYPLLHWKKSIVNFNKYLVEYCQLNIY